jgi:hypothetical protein
MVRPAAVLVALSCTLLVGCGDTRSGANSPSGNGGTTSAAPPATSLEALWRDAKQSVGWTPGTSDYQAGENRISFLVIDRQARVIDAPTATVWLARGLKEKPYQQVTARSEPIGIPGGTTSHAGSIFVARVELPRAGRYWLLASPNGAATSVRALGNLVVHTHPEAPAVGDRAVASETPTLASVGGNLAALSTATHPDPRLYRLSIAQALARHVPFVVTFATPKFCTSRTCGPVVDVVDAVARKHPRGPVRFIHVEIYEDNKPAEGPNRWTKEWNLPTEPFTFLVDRRGIVRAKLEGAFSVGELERALRTLAT